MSDIQAFPTREQTTLSGHGEVYSFTVLQDGPSGYQEQTPYVLALVQLDDGPKVMAQITDLDGPIQIGDRVEMVTRRLATEGPEGIILYGYKFRQVLPRV